MNDSARPLVDCQANMTCESVKVIARCRPLNQREKDLHSKVVVTMDSCVNQVSILNPHDNSAPTKNFTFDGAYYMDSTTEQIYNDIAYPLVEGVIEGYNGTVFAYGQTGCGKSFSMQGVSDPASQRGIIPRAFEHIFEAIATSEDAKYLVHASYLEIYNEEIRDLLGKDPKKKHDLKEHPERGAYIPGLSQHAVHNVKQCEQIMERGWKNRSVGATLMNADSSRSHSIFTVSLEMMQTDSEGSEHIRKGKLNLVDLAGSERQTKTGATGDRLKEATKINLSLSALGNVISALVDGKSKHIPYRDSKLTRLLQDSLGGNTKTLMVACLSPADNNYDESLSTLRYANRAKDIQNKPKINEDPKDTLLREYQEEIRRLKAMLGGQTVATVNHDEEEPAVSPTINTIEEDQTKLKTEYEKMMQDLRDKYDEEQRSHAKLQDDVNRLRQHYEDEMLKLNTKYQDNHTNHYINGETAKVETAEGQEQMDDVLGNDTVPQKELTLNHALRRLQELEEQMVGGEKAHDKELKEKRLKKKKAAEKRLRILADALQQVDEDDKAMLKVYDNIQEELKAKTDLLKKEKQRVRALEREIKDLQSEFEFDRMDYLETIRRQDQQIRLLQQILDKIQPCLRRDCNYSNMERVKGESVWDEDQQRWRLPDLVIIKTKLPPAGIQPGARVTSHYGQPRNGVIHYGDEPEEDKFLQKLERGEQEDIAGNYFKPKRAKELLLKAQQESAKLSHMKGNVVNGGSASTSALCNAVLHMRDMTGVYVASSSAGSPSHKGYASGSTANSVGSHSGPSSPDVTVRKPMRLEALSIGDLSKKSKRKKNGFAVVQM